MGLNILLFLLVFLATALSLDLSVRIAPSGRSLIADVIPGTEKIPLQPSIAGAVSCSSPRSPFLPYDPANPGATGCFSPGFLRHPSLDNVPWNLLRERVFVQVYVVERHPENGTLTDRGIHVETVKVPKKVDSPTFVHIATPVTQDKGVTPTSAALPWYAITLGCVGLVLLVGLAVVMGGEMIPWRRIKKRTSRPLNSYGFDGEELDERAENERVARDVMKMYTDSE